jgi:hypothetical protein
MDLSTRVICRPIYKLRSVWHNACAPCSSILISYTVQCLPQAKGGRGGHRFKNHNLLAACGSHVATFFTQWSVRVPPVARILKQVHHRKSVSLSHIYLRLQECFNIRNLYNVTPCILVDRGNSFFGDRSFHLLLSWGGGARFFETLVPTHRQHGVTPQKAVVYLGKLRNLSTSL